MQKFNSVRQTLDSAVYDKVDMAGFSVSTAKHVAETELGFIAGGNVLILADDSISADRLFGRVKHLEVKTAHDLDSAYLQSQKIYSASETRESQQSVLREAETAEQRNTSVYVWYAVLFIGVTVIVLAWRLRSHM